MKNQLNLAALFLATLCAAGLTAQTLAADQKGQRERGTIENVDAKASRLTLREAHHHTTEIFQWDQNTKFFEHAKALEKPKAITAGDLKPGEHVNVFYQKDSTRWMATKVVVTREGTSSHT